MFSRVLKLFLQVVLLHQMRNWLHRIHAFTFTVLWCMIGNDLLKAKKGWLLKPISIKKNITGGTGCKERITTECQLEKSEIDLKHMKSEVMFGELSVLCLYRGSSTETISSSDTAAHQVESCQPF